MANASEPPWSWSPSEELISSLATAPLLYHSGYLDCVCNLIYLHVLNVSKLQKPKYVNVEASTFFSESIHGKWNYPKLLQHQLFFFFEVQS